MRRKLAAFVFMDAVGFSTRMSENQEQTYLDFEEAKRNTIVPEACEHGGNIVKQTGDGFLIEFDSAVDAINFSVGVQQALATDPGPESKALKFRIGGSLGEIIVEDDDVYGDDLNVASRLQQMAPPGGICITAKLHDATKSRGTSKFSFGGVRRLKNISNPVPVWYWPHNAKLTPSDGTWQVGISGLPSIAVLPFDNIGEKPEEEYFVDGLTEDLITNLAYFRTLQVIARNSSFVYKGQRKDVAKIGAELGVNYVLEGSVRRNGDVIRINAQLIETKGGSHVWARRYDDQITDVFSLQDRITEAIATSVDPAITAEEMRRSMRKHPENLDAWDYVLRGLSALNKYQKSENASARDWLCSALKLNPEFAQAHALMARSFFAEGYFHWTVSRESSFRRAFEAAKRAIVIDGLEAEGHVQLTYSALIMHRHDQAVASGEKAVELNPSNAYARYARGLARLYSGNPEGAILDFGHARRLSPTDPMMWLFHGAAGLAHFSLGDFEGALKFGQRAGEAAHGRVVSRLLMAASQNKLGNKKAAANAARDLADLSPKQKKAVIANMPFSDSAKLDAFRESLNMAGW